MIPHDEIRPGWYRGVLVGVNNILVQQIEIIETPANPFSFEQYRAESMGRCYKKIKSFDFIERIEPLYDAK